MNKLKTAVLMAVGLVVLAGCQKATVDVAAVETEIKQGSRDWTADYNAGNVDAVVARYAPDAIVMAPGNPAAAGTDAIRAVVEKESAAAREAGVSIVLNDDDKVGASGNLAWHSGSYVVNDGAGAVVDSGNYMEVQQDVDGKWMIIRDIWNSDNAPAAAPAAAAEAPAT